MTKHLLLLAYITTLPIFSNHQLKPPNILWITAEDMSPKLGCYGDTYATTPKY